MAIEPKNFPLEGKVEGFLSEKALTEHRDVLYKGYVTQYNNISAALEKADVSKANPHYSEWGELKRRETWAHNGVILHEWYFENIGGAGTKPGAKTLELINRDFGSLDNFKAQLLGAGKVAPVGWAVWAHSLLDNKTHVYVVEQHQNHTPWGAIPLLILDEFEHAYFLDYATKRPDYLNKFWDNLNWDVVEKRITQWLAMVGK
jgi:Fe-Mn family superoxide dismutase